MKSILYFGNFNLDESRNKIYRLGLKHNPYKILTCVDQSPGIKKYWKLYKKYKRVKGKYDFVIVGFGGYLSVPLAKILSNKPVIFDALCSFYETEILSRDALKEYPFRMQLVKFVDWVSTRFADKILVETEKQKEFFIDELGVKEDKLVVVYTGVDDELFKLDTAVEKRKDFTVLFRGRIMSEAGVPTVIRAAKMLEHKDIKFLIIGYGCNEAMKEFKNTMKEVNAKNIEYIGEHISDDELVKNVLSCHVSLGQFAKHERLKRTIPHKAFEALALGIPYITAKADGVEEIMTDGKHCLMVAPENPEELAEKIIKLKDDKDLYNLISENQSNLFEEKFKPEKIVNPILEIIRKIK